MSIHEQYGVYGLITDPSPPQLKKGALSTAHNVVFRRPNTAEPRPGFEAGATTVLDAVWKLIPFDGDVLVVGEGEGSAATVWAADGSTFVEDEDAGSLDWANPHIRGTIARRNLYLTTGDAVRKLTASDDIEAERAHGVLAPSHFLLGTTGDPGFLSNDEMVAYRATVSRTDENGLTVVSAPSGRAMIYNAGLGANLSVSLDIMLRGENIAGDVIHVFRSATVPDTLRPSDDLRLVKELVVTSTDVSNGYASLVDSVADNDRGQALYTNPTREGIERSNVRPPLARDLALFQGSLFAANVTFPPRLTFSLSPGTDTDTYTTNGTRTNASATVTVASAAGLKIGQIYTDPGPGGWSGTGPTIITNIVATTLTMNHTWGGATDGAPVALTFEDSIRVKTATEDQYYLASTSSRLLAAFNTAAFPVARSVPSTELYLQAINDATLSNGSSTEEVGARRTFLIEAVLPSHAGFEVYATHGDQYEPPLPEPALADGEPSVTTDVPNGLSWSKADQPEHFLLSALWYVGVETSPILRIIPTRDSLIILKGKGDGIYRLTGFGERSGWRVDPIATDTYLLHPELALETDGRVFAWTNKGMVEVTDAGVSPPLNSPIANQTAEHERTLDGVATAFFAFSLANTKGSELVWGLPNAGASADEGVSTAYVINTRTNAWSTWLDGNSHYTTAVVNPDDGLMYVGRDDSGDVEAEREPDADIVHADAAVAITITDIDADTNELTFTGTYDAQLGDLIESANGEQSIVTELVDATHVIVQSVGVMNTGAATAYAAFYSQLTWLPETGGSSSVWKRYIDHVTHWDDFYGMARWTVLLSADGHAAAQLEYTRTLDRSQHKTNDTRALPPRSASNARHLTHGLIIQNADARWRITGVALNGERAAMRAHR